MFNLYVKFICSIYMCSINIFHLYIALYSIYISDLCVHSIYSLFIYNLYYHSTVTTNTQGDWFPIYFNMFFVQIHFLGCLYVYRRRFLSHRHVQTTQNVELSKNIEIYGKSVPRYRPVPK